MADQSESKPPFWSSLPGMLTGLGAVIVAVTGLITALYSTGAIGSKASSNTNSSPVALVNTSSAAAPAGSEGDRYKTLTGKWDVAECPSQYYNKVECVTWEYEATVSGNKLTLTGKVLAIDGDKNIPAEAERLKSTYVTTLNGTAGVGEYKLKQPDGSTVTTDATIQFKEDFSAFIGKFEAGGEPITLMGRKL